MCPLARKAPATAEAKAPANDEAEAPASGKAKAPASGKAKAPASAGSAAGAVLPAKRDRNVVSCAEGGSSSDGDAAPAAAAGEAKLSAEKAPAPVSHPARDKAAADGFTLGKFHAVCGACNHRALTLASALRRKQRRAQPDPGLRSLPLCLPGALLRHALARPHARGKAAEALQGCIGGRQKHRRTFPAQVVRQRERAQRRVGVL